MVFRCIPTNHNSAWNGTGLNTAGTLLISNLLIGFWSISGVPSTVYPMGGAFFIAAGNVDFFSGSPPYVANSTIAGPKSGMANETLSGSLTMVTEPFDISL